MSSVERVVPVPGMSPGAFTVFSGVLSAGVPAQALHEAVRTGKVRASDLPEMIASVWTRDDSPTTGLSEAGWVEIFRAAGFFSYPPLAVRQPDGSQVPLGRPHASAALYRGSSPERKRRMSWAYEPSMAEELGARHAHFEAAALYKATVAPDAILAYLERRDEGWTVVVDPAGLANIEKLRVIDGHGS
jgi:hypothetical protein